MKVTNLLLLGFLSLSLNIHATDGSPINQVPEVTKNIMGDLRHCIEEKISKEFASRALIERVCEKQIIALNEFSPELSNYIISSSLR